MLHNSPLVVVRQLCFLISSEALVFLAIFLRHFWKKDKTQSSCRLKDTAIYTIHSLFQVWVLLCCPYTPTPPVSDFYIH